MDYAEVTSANLDAAVRWTVARSGTAHGFGAGIDRILIDGVRNWAVAVKSSIPCKMKPRAHLGTRDLSAFFDKPSASTIVGAA